MNQVKKEMTNEAMEVEYTTDLKMQKDDLLNRCSASRFIDLASRQQRTFCVVYRDTMKVKPYFDVEYYTAKGEQALLRYIVSLLCMEFDVEEDAIAISDNSRLLPDKKVYKNSFHLFVDGVWGYNPEFKALANYLNTKKKLMDNGCGSPVIDTAVYSKRGHLRFANQKKRGQGSPVLSTNRLDRYLMVNVQEGWVQYKCPHNAKKAKLNTITKSRPINRVDLSFNDYLPSQAQLDELTVVLMKLPATYASEYTKWRNIGFALKSYSNTRPCFELFNAFSKRCSTKYNIVEVERFWDGIQTTEKPVTIKTRVQVGGPVQRLSLRLELERGAARQRASGSEPRASGSERQRQ